MGESATVPVATGLVCGLALIISFSLLLYEADQELIDESRVPLNKGNNQLIVDIMLQNSTVIELLKDRDVTVSAIADMGKLCGGYFSCAKVYLIQANPINPPRDQMQILVDYTNHKVTNIQHTDGW